MFEMFLKIIQYSRKSLILQKKLFIIFLARISLHARQFLEQYLIPLQRYGGKLLLYKLCTLVATLDQMTSKSSSASFPIVLNVCHIPIVSSKSIQVFQINPSRDLLVIVAEKCARRTDGQEETIYAFSLYCGGIIT